MKQSNSSGACFAILIGEDELTNGVVTIKHLQTAGMDSERKQEQVRREDLLDYLNKYEA